MLKVQSFFKIILKIFVLAFLPIKLDAEYYFHAKQNMLGHNKILCIIMHRIKSCRVLHWSKFYFSGEC